MDKLPGMIRPELQALPQIKDRMTFLYFEHCKLNRQDSAITVTDDQGVVHVPAAFDFCIASWTWNDGNTSCHGIDR